MRLEGCHLLSKCGDLIGKGLGVYAYGPGDVDKFGITALVYDEKLKAALGKFRETYAPVKAAALPDE